MDTFEQKRNSIIYLAKEIIREIFKVSLVSYLLLYLIDNYQIGFVSDYFNINILLTIALITGVITIIFKEETLDDNLQKSLTKMDYLFIIIIGIISSLLVYFNIKEIGKLAYLISAVTGVIIILISILLLKDSSADET